LILPKFHNHVFYINFVQNMKIEFRRYDFSTKVSLSLAY